MRGPGRVPGNVTIRLPVSVGKGIRLFASSNRMADAGTPTAFNSSDDSGSDGLFVAGDTFDREELHQVIFG